MAEAEQNITNFPIKVGPISMSEKNAQKAEVWAEGTDEQVAELGGTHSAKGWAQEAGGGSSEWGKITGTLSNQTDLKNALGGKQDALSTNQLAAVNSGITSTLVGKITNNENDISAIEGKIPAQATSSNQLADKNFVNSSIATNTANFIGTFNSVSDLEDYSGTLTNNDYAFVTGTDSAGNTTYSRYKYTTATNPAGWEFEYTLNNSSFTSDQWTAINSGITSSLVTQIGTNTNDISSLQSGKQDTLPVGTTGQFLQKAEDGVQWASLEIPHFAYISRGFSGTDYVRTTKSVALSSSYSILMHFKTGELNGNYQPLYGTTSSSFPIVQAVIGGSGTLDILCQQSSGGPGYALSTSVSAYTEYWMKVEVKNGNANLYIGTQKDNISLVSSVSDTSTAYYNQKIVFGALYHWSPAIYFLGYIYLNDLEIIVDDVKVIDGKKVYIDLEPIGKIDIDTLLA